ncbi:ABC transporter substrate-binding protein [Salipiger sp. IMCC34102]|uniref:ABC transporter substrate-binding protein n=1 Tax=Salipiger sp. IMCC34102 TaxID=2510647 RepID=UPI00101C1F29|nr:ABC transporter substrate-binding protein [Salipiger sp. IMCC34102]RYH02426.1 ABC transporter substrate-binding protein [Salipiger sp. IMCC34102]
MNCKTTFKTALALSTCLAGSAWAQEDLTEVRLGWCTPVIDVSGGAILGAAMEFGWFEEGGISVDLIPLAGSTDCVLNVETGQIDAAVAAPEAVAVLNSRDGDVKIYYTAFNRNMFGIAVPEESEIQDYADLEGKSIGVASMSSVGVVIARSMAEANGMNPDSDIRIVVSGPPAQARTLLSSGQVDALSYWDMLYETVTASGLPLRKLSSELIDAFPSNGLVASSDGIAENGEALAALARGYAMGTIYMTENPEAATELFFKHFPDLRNTSLSLEEDVAQALPTARAAIGLLARPEGQEDWGASDASAYQPYVDWLVSRGVLSEGVLADDLVDTSLIEQINDFDMARARSPE